MTIEDEAKNFLLLFAKFEYALKETGYVKAGSSNNAKPDWDRFKNSISLQIDREDNDIKEIMTSPPTKQLFVNNAIKWTDRTQHIATDSELIDACLTIRNNLFHGGKCNDSNTKRNRTLLRGAEKIVNAAFIACPQMNPHPEISL